MQIIQESGVYSGVLCCCCIRGYWVASCNGQVWREGGLVLWQKVWLWLFLICLVLYLFGEIWRTVRGLYGAVGYLWVCRRPGDVCFGVLLRFRGLFGVFLGV